LLPFYWLSWVWLVVVPLSLRLLDPRWIAGMELRPNPAMA
jgi:hypothetical protein